MCTMEADEEESLGEYAPSLFNVSMIVDAESELNDAATTALNHVHNNDVTTSTNDSQEDASVRKQSCPTCFRKTAKFLCPNCVLLKCPLSDLRNRCTELSTKRDMLLCGILEQTTELEECGARTATISDNISSYKRLIVMKRTQLAEKRAKLAALRHDRKRSDNMGQKLFEKQSKWLSAIQQREKRVEAAREKLCGRWCRIPIGRRKLTEDLLSTFFPFGPVSSEPTDGSMDCARSDALAEATGTNYVNGRWIYVDDWDDVVGTAKWKVSECQLSDFSKYSAVKEWLYKKNNNRPHDRLIAGSLAALAYIAHLTEILGAVFDVCLPYKLYPADLILANNLSEPEFDTSVVKLNANVSVLCLQQGLCDSAVALSRPLYNLYNLKQNLVMAGANHPYTIPDSLIKAFDSAAAAIVWKDKEREESLANDWEEIDADWFPPCDPPSAPPPSTIGDLLSSATTSVASFFR